MFQDGYKNRQFKWMNIAERDFSTASKAPDFDDEQTSNGGNDETSKVENKTENWCKNITSTPLLTYLWWMIIWTAWQNLTFIIVFLEVKLICLWYLLFRIRKYLFDCSGLSYRIQVLEKYRKKLFIINSNTFLLSV